MFDKMQLVRLRSPPLPFSAHSLSFRKFPHRPLGFGDAFSACGVCPRTCLHVIGIALAFFRVVLTLLHVTFWAHLHHLPSLRRTPKAQTRTDRNGEKTVDDGV